jgi:hypothetical protein
MVLLTGLALDIIGAALLVVPDVPVLDWWFESGRLRSAHETLTHKKVDRLLVSPETYQSIENDETANLPDDFTRAHGLIM